MAERGCRSEHDDLSTYSDEVAELDVGHSMITCDGRSLVTADNLESGLILDDEDLSTMADAAITTTVILALENLGMELREQRPNKSRKNHLARREVVLSLRP